MHVCVCVYDVFVLLNTHCCHCRALGGISTPGAVGVFGSEGGDADQSAVAVCAYTEDGVVHRVLLQRPAAPPGDKVLMQFFAQFRIACMYIT